MVTTINPVNRIASFDTIGTPAIRGDDSLATLKHAQLDFDVKLVPVKNPITGEVVRDGDDAKYFASIREDTNEVLGIVEGRYRIIPNRNVFDIADAMVEEDGAQITRASSLENGARCFMNLEWPKEKSISVVGDIVGRRAILQNAHNGKFSTLIRLMPLRLACINGMVVPVPCFTFEFRIKHTESAGGRLNEARRIMAGASKYFDAFGLMATQMAKTEVTNAAASLLLKRMAGLDKTTDATDKKRSEIISLFDGGQAGGNHEALRGTAWGLLNAVSEYADHAGRVRKTRGNSVEIQRFKSGFEGTAQRLKLAAYDVLLKDSHLGLKEYSASLN